MPGSPIDMLQQLAQLAATNPAAAAPLLANSQAGVGGFLEALGSAGNVPGLAQAAQAGAGGLAGGGGGGLLGGAGGDTLGAPPGGLAPGDFSSFIQPTTPVTPPGVGPADASIIGGGGGGSLLPPTAQAQQRQAIEAPPSVQAPGGGFGQTLEALQKSLQTVKDGQDTGPQDPQARILPPPAVNTTSSFRPQGLQELIQAIMAGQNQQAGGAGALGQLIRGGR